MTLDNSRLFWARQFVENLEIPNRFFMSKNSEICQKLTLFFPMFPFDPPENIRKPLVF